MPKKKKGKGKKGKKEVDKNAPPPEDPLDKLSEQDLALYKDMFEMADLEKKGTIGVDRIVEIMSDMTEEKVDNTLIEELVKENAVKKEENADEDAEDLITYTSFLKIVVMHLNES
jgi:Ca2+-binding EF-hand superfamily protein